jgi:hypothetical protein
MLQIRIRVGIVVKVAGVALPLDAGDDGTAHLLVVQGVPVDAVEEGVGHDAGAAAGDVAKPLGRIGPAQREDELPRHGVQVEGGRAGREPDVAGDDLLVHAHRVLIPEGRLPDQHLVHEDAERPPVHCRAVALVADDFGGEVLGRAAEGVSDAAAVAVGGGFAALTKLPRGWGWREAFGKSKID